MPVRSNMKNALLDNRIMALREAHQEAGIKRAELDLSGGIDSAVMAGVLVLALGPENVTLVHSRFATNPAQSDRARRLAEGLDCPLIDVGLGAMWEVLMGDMVDALVNAHADAIGSAHDAERLGYAIDYRDVVISERAPAALTQFMEPCEGGFKTQVPVFPDPSDKAAVKTFLRGALLARCEANPTILGSIRSCLRAPIGRGFNRLTGGGIRHGTGNECEDRWLRFYQKGGDGEVDSNPIAMLSKGEVYQLAWMLMKRLPQAAEAFRDTILATPSPDLWGTGDAHTDEAELKTWLGVPFTYSRIDIETGEYSHVGSIERVSRFLDVQSWGAHPISDYLFGVYEPDWPEMTIEAKDSGLFVGFTSQEITDFLKAARRAEKITRHKMNPNIPTYGTREELVRKGILTNNLPTIG